MNIIERALFNHSREDVDQQLYMLWDPGWYDTYTTLRLMHQTDCAIYCTKLFDYLELLREVAQIESQYSE